MRESACVTAAIGALALLSFGLAGLSSAFPSTVIAANPTAVQHAGYSVQTNLPGQHLLVTTPAPIRLSAEACICDAR